MSFPWNRGTSEAQAICRNGTRDDAIKLFVTKPASLSETFKGHSLIHEAAEYNNTEVLDELLRRGADVNACTLSNRTPLIIAATKGNEGAIEKLVEYGADPYKKDNSGRSARGTVAAQLFSKLALVDSLFEYEFTYACRRGLVSELSDLFDEDKAALQPLLERGLEIAASCGQIKSVELLVLEGARSISDNVSVAAINGHVMTASYLMLCSHCRLLDANAVRNLTTEETIKEKGVDVTGAFAGNCVINDDPTELFFDRSFDMTAPVLLVQEGKALLHGTDDDADDCLLHLLLTKHDKAVSALEWGSIGLSYVSPTWLHALRTEGIRQIDISYNQIGPTLPSALSNLSCLQKFSCNNNALRELPACIFELPSLSYLNASSNCIERLNINTSVSQSLKNVNLSKNLLHSLPEPLRDSGLQTVRLSRNLFVTFPGVICGMTNLLHLEIDHCKFLDIPNELGRLEELQHLEIPRVARIEHLHQELPKTGKILAFLKEKLYSLKPLFEMKLVVVGREGRGKTTLIKRLQRDYMSNKNISTVGIHISKLKLAPSETTRRSFSLGSRTLLLHSWDFGGQEEYYATHQCFITPATLYLLVFSLANGIAGIDELRVWLGNISARAAGSTVLIVGTYLDKVSESECRELLEEVHSRVKKWGFGNEATVLVPVITAASTEHESEWKRSVEKLAEAIAREAERMRYKKKPVLGQLIPNSYLVLIEEINKLKVRYEKERKIPVVQEEELWEVIRGIPACDDIDNEFQFSAVTDLMHNLGIILHFKEPSLQNQYFLDPCWLCSMMGQIVTIRERNPYVTSGILEQRRVRHMLKDKRFPDDMFPQYLRILNRFEIALKIDGDKILIPCLLPPDEEVTYSIPSDILYFERQISFRNLPSGFIPRILVSTLSYIISVSNELCSPKFDRERQYSGSSVFEADTDHARALLTRGCRSSLPRLTRTNSGRFSGRFSEYSFSSQNSEASQVEAGMALELTPGAASTTDPLETIRCDSREDSPEFRAEVALDVDEILLDEDEEAGDEGPVTLSLGTGEPARYDLLTPEYLTVWRRGLSFTHPNLHLYILPLVEEEREGIVFVVSRGYMGRRALCHIIDTISTLVEDWYPGLTSGFCENQVTQKIPCPECHGYTFTYEECLQELGDSDEISCPNHPDSTVKLSTLIPDIYLSDLEGDSMSNYKEIVFKETAETRLGGGAFGSVYRGTFRGESVAIKTFNSFPMKPEAPYLELRREVNVLKKMSNMCIVKMLAVSLRPVQCLVIEYAAHSDLEVQLSKPDPLPRLLLYKVLHQTACALAYLHKHRIIYRDIKPSNILVFSLAVEETPNVKLSDYGIAGIVSGGGVKGFHGTPGFQAPEMLLYQGLEEYTEAVDVYSYAFLLYEGICRKKAYSGQHRFDINRNVVASIRPEGYKSIRMARFGMRNLKKLMEECWVQDPQRRPKMPQVAKMLSHIGYQMFMGHTMPPNAISARATCASYSEHTQTLWIGCSEGRTCKIMLMRGSTMDVSMLHDPDLELGCSRVLAICQIREKMLVLARSNFSIKLFRYCNEDPEDPELESISETLTTGNKHVHVQSCLAATPHFALVGHCHGLVSRISFSDLKETSKQFKLPCEEQVIHILHFRKQGPSLVEENKTVINKLMNLSKTEELPVVQLVILTRYELFITSSDFRSPKRFTFPSDLEADVHAVISREKLFSCSTNGTFVQMFNLKQERPCKWGIDLRGEQLQLLVDCRDLTCTCLAATEHVVWVGTNHGAVLLFSTHNKHSFLTYIRPCVGDILTILPYSPSLNLLGEASVRKEEEAESARNSCPVPTRGVADSPRRHITHSSSLNFTRTIPGNLVQENRHDRYNSNYTAGVFVCVTGMGRFADAGHLLMDTPASHAGDSASGLFAVVLEQPPVEHIQFSNKLFQAGGLL